MLPEMHRKRGHRCATLGRAGRFSLFVSGVVCSKVYATMLSMFLCILRLLAEFATVHKIAGYYDADRDRLRLVSLRVAGSAGAM